MFSKNAARKGQQIAEILLLAAHLTSAEVKDIIDMPSGAVIDDIYPVLDETFDPTASAVIEFGTADDTNKFVASQNIFTGQALGGRAGDVTGRGYRFAAAGAITAKYTSGGGVATQGKIRCIVEYHMENHADFIQH